MKTVKMVAVIDGEEVSIGKCHPGQARIMQKQGMAEWKDGKLLLFAPKPPAFRYSDGGITVELSQEELEMMPRMDSFAEDFIATLQPGPVGRQHTVEVVSDIRAWVKKNCPDGDCLENDDGDIIPFSVEPHDVRLWPVKVSTFLRYDERALPDPEDFPTMEPEPELPEEVESLEELWALPDDYYKRDVPEVLADDFGAFHFGENKCPNCGIGYDTDGDGDCAFCAPRGPIAVRSVGEGEVR